MSDARTKADAKRTLILDAPIVPTLATLSVPTILGALIQVTISVVEGAMIGRMGIEALAGAALVFPVFMLTTMLSAGAIGGAVSGAMARANGSGGSGDPEQVERVAHAALVIAIGAGLLMGAALTVAAEPLFRLLGGRDASLQAALDYGSVFFPGLIGIWLFNMTAGLLRGTGDMVRPMIAIGAVTAIHAAICLPLVEALGMRGAALAVVAAYGIGAAGLLTLILSGRASFRLILRRPLPWRVIGRCLSAGTLAGTQSVLTIVTSLMVAAFIGRLGNAALAGYGIAARLELLMVPIIFGVGAALIAMVGGNAGAGRRARAIRIGWIGSVAAGALVGGLGLLVALVPQLWIPLFSSEPEVVAVAGTALAIIGPCYAFFGLGLALYFASQGLGSLFWPVFGTVVRLVVIAAGFLMVGSGGGASAGEASGEDLFGIVALGMICYGTFNAVALRLGPWRR